ncbi:MAG: FAD:protein FMN transferase [Candidatus Eisenbacteria bacterium]
MGSRIAAILALVGVAVLGTLVLRPRDHWESHSGSTMGTTFHVTWEWRDRAGAGDRLRSEIDRTLETVNDQMSTYREESEIRRFERAPAGEWFAVSPETRDVVEEALALARTTTGAFDPTVSPLVRLWGFGSDGRRTTTPDSAEITAARRRVGSRRIETRLDPPALRRTDDEVSLDLSAIAKGHGVDRVSAVLEEAGAGAYLVEIGGEVRVRGEGPHGPWRVALEQPADPSNSGRPDGAPGPDQRTGLETLVLENGAVATSGTYLNQFTADGARYHHVIDPRTGYPAEHATVQVTVVAETCQTADARATALLVLGEDEGLALAEREHWAARFLTVDVSSPTGTATGGLVTNEIVTNEIVTGGSETSELETSEPLRTEIVTTEFVTTEFAKLSRIVPSATSVRDAANSR